MAVRIAEINAVAAARPMRAAFDRDAGILQPLFPDIAFICGDGKGHMHRTSPVVRRNRAAGQMHRVQRMAAQE